MFASEGPSGRLASREQPSRSSLGERQQDPNKERHLWDQRLGNEFIRTGTGPPIQIKDPSAAKDLLDLALELARHEQRLIFFCGCPWPREGGEIACHRAEVASLVLNEARKREIRVKIEEWPGGKPIEIDLDVTPEDFAAVKRGRWSVPLSDDVDLARFAGLPWCSVATLHSGDEMLYRIVGPAIHQTTGWVFPIWWREDDPTAALDEYRERSSRLRIEWGLEATLSK